MRTLRTASALAALSLIGSGCGGGSTDRSPSDFSPSPQAPDYQSISGTIQGLEGTLTLSWAGNSQILNDGAFSIPVAFESGDSFELTVSREPLSQRCTINGTTTFSNREDDVTGVAISCETMNLVRVSVVNFFTGEALAGEDVTATWMDGGTRRMLSGTTDAEGRLVLELPLFDGRVVVNADPDDFGEQSKIVTNTATPAGRLARLLMLPANVDTTFDAAVGTTLSVGGSEVLTIPANALQDATGSPYSGTVSVELTVVDPSVDVELMPGDYISRDPGGATSPVQSYGAVSVTLTGSNGEALDLITGQVADIDIPVAEAERGAPPSVMPLFHYDALDGYWIAEGNAALDTLPSGVTVYSGQVSHFTTWNADAPYTPVFVHGCVVNAQSEPYPNVRVDATGSNYLGASRDITDDAGQFSIPVRPSSQVLITVGDGLQSGTVQVTTVNADVDLDDCLVASPGSSTINLSWGENPSDLDTRLYGFSADDPADDFEVNYTQRSVTAGSLTIDLDVDDVTSFGPEVVTFPDFPFPGVFRYAVHLFSGSGSIQASPARVELNLRGEVSVYAPPGGTPTLCWAVLDLEVDQSGNVTVVPLNSWESESYCTAGDFPRPSLGTTRATSAAGPGLSVEQPSNPLVQAIQHKYYAR